MSQNRTRDEGFVKKQPKSCLIECVEERPHDGVEVAVLDTVVAKAALVVHRVHVQELLRLLGYFLKYYTSSARIRATAPGVSRYC
jgi:hypothetical protein